MAAGYCYFLGINSNAFFLKDNKKTFILGLNVPKVTAYAGTMISCCAKEIIMGKHSNLGPIDPQYGMYRAHGIIEEFENIKQEHVNNPLGTQVWGPILSKYTPTLVGECQKVIDWSNGLVKQWLMDNMFNGIPDAEDKANRVVESIGSHALTKSHSRHLHIDYLRNLGLNITALEDDVKLQDKAEHSSFYNDYYK